MIFQTFLQSKKWQHKESSVRLEAVTELNQAIDPHEPEAVDAVKILADMAQNDGDQAVRIAAIHHVRSTEVLELLQKDDNEEIRNAALIQYCRLVSGSAPSTLDANQRLALMEAMEQRPMLLAVLHDCACDETGLATLLRLQSKFECDASTLLEIAAHSNNHTIRHAAAIQIDSPELLEQLSGLVRHKDKSVLKICKDRLQVIHDAEAKLVADQALALKICDDIESLTHKVIGGLSQAQYEYKVSQWQDVSAIADTALQQRFADACKGLEEKLQAHAQEEQGKALQAKCFTDLAQACTATEATVASLTTPLDAEQIAQLETQHHALVALRAQNQGASEEADPVLAQADTLIASLALDIRAFNALQAKQEDLSDCFTHLQKLTAKNTAGLKKRQAQFEKLFQKQAWPEALPPSELFNQCLEMETLLERLVIRNRAYLDKLHSDSLAHITALEEHIEQGQVNEAQRLWDKVQGAIKNADDSLKKTLHDLLMPFKPRISELIDWKNFAAAEKKKELITQMQALVESTMHAGDKAKRIKALQEDWKNLGHSVLNDSLWAQFNEAARKAFEPCKEYFKERKTKLQSNLAERNKICEALEALVPTLQEETVNISNLNKIESKAVADWKLYAPVEQAKIKKLQKRFNAVLTDIRQFKRKVLQGNAVRKLDLIAQAEKLDELEDVQEAMSEAKRLQAEWKSIGPSPFKDDRTHWNSFRAACDKLFNKRKNEAPAKSARGTGSTHSTSPAVAAVKGVLSKISDLLRSSTEELVNSRREFKTLEESFYEHLKADLKHEKRALQEQFNKLSRQYESKLKAAPDKKSLQLIGQVKTKAQFLEALEAAVLAGKEASSDVDALSEQWQALGRVSDLKQEQALEQRFQALYRGVDKALLKRQAKDNEEKARELCISAEIIADLETPAADKALRMQVQLKQLKNSFGSRESKSAAQQVSELEIQMLCLGPLESTTRKSCDQRIEKSRNKT